MQASRTIRAPVTATPRIAIVGAGFTGTLLAVHLLREARVPVVIHLFEQHGWFGRGVAFSTGNPSHLLNVRVANMSQTSQYADFLATEPAPSTILGLFIRLRAEIRHAEAAGYDWRSVIDAFRPHTERCWRTLPEPERRRFLRHLRPYWEIHRHRMAPRAAERLWGAFRGGQLLRRRGRLTAISEDGSDLVLRFRSRGGRSAHTLRAAHVVNSSGPQFDVSRLDHPLVASVLHQGLARPDRLGLGLEVTPDFRLVGAHGEPAPGLLALGPIVRGGSWESTAVPELRTQCARVGRMLAQQLMRADA